MQNAPHTGTIRELLWDEREGRMRYQIVEGGQPIEQLYSRDDLRRVEPIA
jgi:hypothetical protein